MSRLASRLGTRLSAVPAPLGAHAILVLTAAVVAPGGELPVWFSLGVVALILWPLLHGSRLVWWVELVGIGLSLAGLASTWQRVSARDELYAFVPPETLSTLAALLAAAWLLLLAPSVRTFCRHAEGGPRTAAGVAVAALFLGGFPPLALSVEPRLPSRGNSLEGTANVQYVGTDPAGPSVFYVGGEHDETCLVVLEPRSSSRGCWHHGLELEHVDGTRTANVHAWALPKRVVKVTAVYGSGPPRKARLLTSPAAAANLFYVTESLDDLSGIRAYDATGRRIVDCRWC